MNIDNILPGLILVYNVQYIQTVTLNKSTNFIVFASNVTASILDHDIKVRHVSLSMIKLIYLTTLRE